MADVLWPALIPLSILMMESNAKKRKIIRLLLISGLSVSIYYSCCLLFMNVTPQIMSYHIIYNSDFPKLIAIPVFILYLIATLTPLFISSIERTHMMGILMFFSCLVTAIFFTQYLTSVWCFFAALISGVIYWILSDAKKKFRFDKLNLLKEKLVSNIG
jgi:Na+/melibiose symporter-like transporter